MMNLRRQQPTDPKMNFVLDTHSSSKALPSPSVVKNQRDIMIE